MKSIARRLGDAWISRLAVILVVLGFMVATPWLSSARTPLTTINTTAITIINNSAREIKHVYLSPTNQDDWGPDQLNNGAISIGGSFTLSNVSCPAADLKVIAENEDGCFFYHIVSCGENGSWTIANDATPDCGG